MTSAVVQPRGAGSAHGEAVLRRDRTIDAIRGLAIILMIADHTLGFAQNTDMAQPWMTVARLSITRAALPAFMVCSGILLAGHSVSSRRWAQVLVAAVLVNTGALVAGMSEFVPDILALWCLVMLLAGPVRRAPATAAVLGMLQAVYWRVPIGTYQPGWIVAFVAIGVLVARSGDREVLEPLGHRLPEWVAVMGRRPLSWYVGHLAVLGGLTGGGNLLGWW
ncbi:MAG: heparan-alpha-glucosaminide N-acetyltransferase domain-containing protein [Microthrixaceae bacterium]|nr:DUF1624 domain-containing protein [Microthrixaceae bacterium]